jgi:hypothetical protein
VNCLFVNDWLIFFLCEWHNDHLHEKKRESNAILWEIINEEIWNENSRKIKMIFKNKDNLKSNKSQNLFMLKLIHFENDDKISFRRNENF